MTAAEEWRPIEGYEGYYEVSSFGRVRSLRDREGRPRILLRKWSLKDGNYCIMTLFKDGRKHSCSVHSLVATAFIGPRPAGVDVNHKDFDTTNNHASNLEYLTRHENVLHTVRAGRHRYGVNHRDAVLNDDIVKDIRRQYAAGVILKTLAAKYGIAFNTVWKIVNYKTWKWVAA